MKSGERTPPTIAELEVLLEKDYDVEILPDGSITATNDRPAKLAELLRFSANTPSSY
jgi:hypothetical protein